MRDSARIWEIVKTVILAVLLVMLVCVCILYMLSYQGTSSYGFTKDTMNRLSGESVKYKYLNYFDASCTLPDFIGFSDGSDSIGFSYGLDAVETVYSDVLRFYDKLFGSEGEVTALTPEEGEDAFSESMRGRYIYISYFCDLPKSVILGTADPDKIFSGISGEYIKEIFIVPEKYLYEGITVGKDGAPVYTSIYSFCAVARDSEGNYYRYTTKYVPEAVGDVSFNTNYYLSYNTSGSAMRYEFAAAVEKDAFLEKYGFIDKVTDTTVIYADRFSAKLLSLEREMPSDDAIKSILEAFFINPEKASSYSEENGVKIYFDEGRNVKITPEGRIQYTALGASGIPFEEVFGYNPDADEYDIFDYIGAALVVTDTLKPIRDRLSVTGFSLFLSNIEYDGSTIRLDFGFRYGGIPLLLDGKADAVSFEMCDGMIKSISFEMWTATVSDGTAQTPDFLWTVRNYIMDASDKCSFLFSYLFSEEKSESEIEIAVLP